MSRVPEVNGSMVIGSMGYFTDPYKGVTVGGYSLGVV